jgi:hypothetical protein
MEQRAEKTAFAELLLSMPSEPFKAALQIFPDPKSVGYALWVSDFWPKDPFVKAEMERISKRDPYEGVATKADLLKLLQHRMYEGTQLPDGRVVKPTPLELTAMMKLFAEMQGMIEKPAAGQTLNLTLPRAIEVPVHASDDNWEEEAKRQQHELLAVSRNRF